MTEEIAITLDEHAQETLRDYLDAGRVEAEAKAKREKARDALLEMFRLHGASVGMVDDRIVCRLVRTDRQVIDSARLKDEEPYTYRRFSRMSTAYYVREVRS